MDAISDVAKPKRGPKKTTFEPRPSLLDYETIRNTNHPMRGFMALFWIILVVGVLQVSWKHYNATGLPFSSRTYIMMTQNGYGCLLADLAMLATMFPVIILQSIVAHTSLPLWLAQLLQHLYQAAWFATFICYAVFQDWGWLQTGAFTLHLTSMLMKMHSYQSVNSELAIKNRRFQQIVQGHKKLDKSSTESDLSELTDLKNALIRETISFPRNIGSWSN